MKTLFCITHKGDNWVVNFEDDGRVEMVNARGQKLTHVELKEDEKNEVLNEAKRHNYPNKVITQLRNLFR